MALVKNRKHIRAKNRKLRNRYIDYKDINDINVVSKSK